VVDLCFRRATGIASPGLGSGNLSVGIAHTEPRLARILGRSRISDLCQGDIATGRWPNTLLCHLDTLDIERASRRPITPVAGRFSPDGWVDGENSGRLAGNAAHKPSPGPKRRRHVQRLMPHCFVSGRLVSVSESTRDLGPSLLGRHIRKRNVMCTYCIGHYATCMPEPFVRFV